MHVILSLKLKNHKYDLALFVYGQLLKRTLLVVLPTILIQIPIRAFLNPVPVYLLRPVWNFLCCLAAGDGMPEPQYSTPRKSVLVLYVLHYFSYY